MEVFRNLPLKGEGWDTSRCMVRAVQCTASCAYASPVGLQPQDGPSTPLLRVTAKGQGKGHQFQQENLQTSTGKEDFP